MVIPFEIKFNRSLISLKPNSFLKSFSVKALNGYLILKLKV